jgi:hypothetical protein
MNPTTRRILIALGAAVAVLTAAFPAWASGPGEGGRRVRLNDKSAGPYRLRVVTSPTPPQVENLYVEVRVTDAMGGKTLTDVNVVVSATPVEVDGQSIRVEATHDIAPIPTEYAAHLPVDATGLWEIGISVDGPDGAGTASFVLMISSPPSLSWLVAIGAPVGGLAALIAAFIWLQRNTEREGVTDATPSSSQGDDPAP